MLSLALHQKAKFPVDPRTGLPVENPKERIKFLVDELSQKRATIVVPSPALSEFLVIVFPSGPEYVQTLNKSARFDVRPFDEMAAIEAAEMYRSFLDSGDKKGGAAGPVQKINVDRQIVAITKVSGAERLYTSDRDVINIANRWKVPVTAVWELPLPAEDQPFLFGPAPDAGD